MNDLTEEELIVLTEICYFMTYLYYFLQIEERLREAIIRIKNLEQLIKKMED